MAAKSEGIVWRADGIEDVLADLEVFERDYSDVINIDDVSMPEKVVALLLSDDQITHAAVAERGPMVATRKRRVSFRQVVRIGPIALESLTAAMGRAAAGRLTEIVSRDAVRVPPATWNSLLDAIWRIDPAAAAAIDDLAPSQIVRPSSERLVQRDERDAVLLSLEIAGLARPQLPLPTSSDTHFTGVHDRLQVSEDRLIEHDAGRIPGWVLKSEQPAFSRTFADHAGRALTVMNVNRDPIERTTGVDLIYYRQDTDSFVMVQYKRLRSEPPNWVYRPRSDKNWRKELARMEALVAAIGQDEPATLRDYHFEPNPFFIKLCKPLAVELSVRELVGGLYLPLTYWKILEGAPEAKGKGGGVAIGFHNAGKWLTNTLFVDLMQRDWIGSSPGASSVLREVLDRSLGLGRSAIVAIDTGSIPASRELTLLDTATRDWPRSAGDPS